MSDLFHADLPDNSIDPSGTATLRANLLLAGSPC
jgi:hypothetical protein